MIRGMSWEKAISPTRGSCDGCGIPLVTTCDRNKNIHPCGLDWVLVRSRIQQNENDRLIASAPEMHAALLEIAATTTNGNSDPDRIADALGEIQRIVRRALEAIKEVSWEGEEESVRDEHAELIEDTRAALEATKERP